MDMDSVANELYGLAPEEFTATRNARAKQARAAGDRGLATQIQSLRKPTSAAWLLNQLVRSHYDETQLLLDLGRELRDVLADVKGDELRELTRQRYQLVSALVQQARVLGQAQGARVTDDVAQAVRTTLEATLAGEASADALAAGRLTEALEISSGFSVGSSGAERPRPAPRWEPPEATVTDLDVERQRRARQAADKQVAEAAKREDRARSAADRAAEQLESVRGRAEAASATVDELRGELDAALAALAELEQEQRDAQEANNDAGQAAHRAAEELAQAQQQLDDLGD